MLSNFQVLREKIRREKAVGNVALASQSKLLIGMPEKEGVSLIVVFFVEKEI